MVLAKPTTRRVTGSRLKPAFTWKAALASVKRFPEGWSVGYGATYTTQQDEIIGVLNVGHGDGYQRKPGGSVLIEGSALRSSARSAWTR